MITTWHAMLAVSLDGRIARRDGGIAWLEAFPPEAFGYDAFYESIDAIVMGRATYDAVRQMGEWPYEGKPVTVVTSRELDEDPPEGVEARGGLLTEIAAELEFQGHERVWIEGGGKLVRDMLQIGRLDVLELIVIPVVLGDGIPLFPEGTPETWLRLVSATPGTGGALHLVYERVP
jgi:dihydrofolate reductase